MFGVRVVTFSLGFGKRIWGFEHGGTDYRVSALPLGGYVRMAGEHPDEKTADPGDFMNKPRWQRILVYLAGPAMNAVLSVGIFAAVFMQGFWVQGLQDVDPVVGYIVEGSAAELAGLQIGDHILAAGGESVDKWGDLAFIVSTSPDRPLLLDLERAGERTSVELIPKADPRHGIGDAGFAPKLVLRTSGIIRGDPAHKAGFQPGDAVLRVNGKLVTTDQSFVDEIESNAGKEIEVEVLRGEETLTLSVVPKEVEGVGKIGVNLGIYRPLPFGEAVAESVRFNIDIIDKTLKVLGKLLTREIAAKSALSGPIEIAVWTGQAAQRGFQDLIYLMGFLSISIGFMNMLPIPVLDGGNIAI
ncbi:uncharacterized protein LOC110243366, partial [Exaiptasia diaphana]|uniref:PDZ domain-containing protein n=1 Tax=Exaiptasia diaphana TaxID=2652724 RepID=A0A913XI20_EXADI